MLAEELYDYTSEASVVRNDAYLIEQENIIDNPAYIETRDRLRKQMDQMLTLRTTRGTP